jgi:uncharacterized ferritin-like protein (DUF455 family)
VHTPDTQPPDQASTRPSWSQTKALHAQSNATQMRRLLFAVASPRLAGCAQCRRNAAAARRHPLPRAQRWHASAATAHAHAPVAPPSAADEWEGLRQWRFSGVNEARRWGDADAPAAGAASGELAYASVALPPTLAECGRLVLLTADPEVRRAAIRAEQRAALRYAAPLLSTASCSLTQGKAALTHAAFRAWCAGTLPLGAATAPDAPARPPLPLLVPIKQARCRCALLLCAASLHHQTACPALLTTLACLQVPTPAESPLALPAHVLHTLAHIELNAIDLAWDTVVRFSTGPAARVLPAGFFADFARIADDESRHLGWCLARLAELGHAYGDLPAHNQLWEGAAASAEDVVERLAVVPCVQEARGLDAGPRLAGRLVGFGDARSAALVKRIATEEWAHVAVGVAWLHAVCAAREQDAGDAFRDAVARHVPDGLKGPFDRHARERVGLRREWWDPNGTDEAPAQAERPKRRGRAKNGGQAQHARALQAAAAAAAPEPSKSAAAALAGVRARLEQVVAAEASAADGT